MEQQTTKDKRLSFVCDQLAKMTVQMKAFAKSIFGNNNGHPFDI
jgi:hypothetical protein